MTMLSAVILQTLQTASSSFTTSITMLLLAAILLLLTPSAHANVSGRGDTSEWIGFAQRSATVESSSSSVLVDIVRRCPRDSAAGGCTGAVSVVVSTQSPFSCAANVSAIATLGSAKVAVESLDARLELDEWVQLGADAPPRRVAAVGPHSMTLDAPYYGEATTLAVYALPVDVPLPGSVWARTGFTVETSASFVTLLSATDVVRLCGVLRVVASVNATSLTFETSLPLRCAGRHAAYSEAPYTALQDEEHGTLTTVTTGRGNLDVACAPSCSALIAPGDLLKLGGVNFVVERVDAATLRLGALVTTAAKGATAHSSLALLHGVAAAAQIPTETDVIALKRRINVRLPGTFSVARNSTTVRSSADVRGAISAGDLFRIADRLFVVATGQGFDRHRITLERPFDAEEDALHAMGFAARRYVPASGRARPLVGSTVVRTTSDIRSDVGAGHIVKLGVRNYVVEETTSASRLKLTEAFFPRQNDTVAVCVQMPNGASSALKHRDYVPDTRRIVLPEGVDRAQISFRPLPTARAARGHAVVSELTLSQPRFRDEITIAMGGSLLPRCVRTLHDASILDFGNRNMTLLLAVGDALMVIEHGIEIAAHVVAISGARVSLNRPLDGTDPAHRLITVRLRWPRLHHSTMRVTIVPSVTEPSHVRMGDVRGLVTAGDPAIIPIVRSGDNAGAIRVFVRTSPVTARSADALGQTPWLDGVANGTTLDATLSEWISANGDSVHDAMNHSSFAVLRTAEDQRRALDLGDIVKSGSFLGTVVGMESTEILLRAPVPGASVAINARAGEELGRSAQRVLRLTRRLPGRFDLVCRPPELLLRQNKCELTYSDSALAGKVEDGEYIVVANRIVQLGVRLHSYFDQKVGQLATPSLLVLNDTMSAYTTKEDVEVRHGFVQRIRCHAEGGTVRFQLGHQQTRPMSFASSTGAVQRALEGLGRVLRVKVTFDSTQHTLCAAGRSRVPATHTIRFERVTFDSDELSQLVPLVEKLYLLGQEGKGYVHVETPLGVRRGDRIRIGDSLHRISTRNPFKRNMFNNRTLIPLDKLADVVNMNRTHQYFEGAAYRVNTLPLSDYFDVGSVYDVPAFKMTPQLLLAGTLSITSGSTFMKTSQDLREGRTQQVRVREAFIFML